MLRAYDVECRCSPGEPQPSSSSSRTLHPPDADPHILPHLLLPSAACVVTYMCTHQKNIHKPMNQLV